MTAIPPDRRLTRARTLARVLDSAVGIPGTKFRFGLDPILGLVPGLGDLVGAALSGYIVLTGIRLGAPPSMVVRMIANVAIDTGVGSVPLIGDLFDAAWKSNLRNLSLIERHVGSEDSVTTASRFHTIAGVLLLVLVGLAGAALTVLVVRLVVDLF